MTTTLLPVGTICTLLGTTDTGRLVVVLQGVGAFPHANVTEGYWCGTFDRLPFASISVYKAADGTFNTKPNLSNACIVDRKHLRVGDDKAVDLPAEREGAVIHENHMSHAIGRLHIIVEGGHVNAYYVLQNRSEGFHLVSMPAGPGAHERCRDAAREKVERIVFDVTGERLTWGSG